jgi:hypothetical protein
VAGLAGEHFRRAVPIAARQAGGERALVVGRAIGLQAHGREAFAATLDLRFGKTVTSPQIGHVHRQFSQVVACILEGSGDSLSFSFNKDLYRLIKAGRISKADGLRFSPNPQALEMNLKGIFIKS